MSPAEDSAILEHARRRNAAVVTLDADFHAILAVSGAQNPSVIRIRVQGLNGEMLAGMTVRLVAAFGSELQNGCLITVKARKTTCRKLPIAAESGQSRSPNQR